MKWHLVSEFRITCHLFWALGRGAIPSLSHVHQMGIFCNPCDFYMLYITQAIYQYCVYMCIPVFVHLDRCFVYLYCLYTTDVNDFYIMYIE